MTKTTPTFFVPPPAEGESISSIRCRALLLSDSDICKTVRKQSQYGQTVGVTILAIDEDIHDELSFELGFQKMRDAASSASWEHIPMGNASKQRFATNTVGRTVQLIMNSGKTRV